MLVAVSQSSVIVIPCSWEADCWRSFLRDGTVTSHCHCLMWHSITHPPLLFHADLLHTCMRINNPDSQLLNHFMWTMFYVNDIFKPWDVTPVCTWWPVTEGRYKMRNAKVRKCKNDNTKQTVNLTLNTNSNHSSNPNLTLTLKLTKILTPTLLIGVFCMLFFAIFRIFALSHFAFYNCPVTEGNGLKRNRGLKDTWISLLTTIY